MAFQLSPGVNITEIDLTTVVPAVATSDGAFAGVFRWGPIGERVLIDSENLLVQRFAKPTNFNAETFFTAASFLSYANRLYVSRAADTDGSTPVVNSITTTSSNSVYTVSNTTGIQVGMYVSQTSNSTILNTVGTSVTVVAVNSSSFTLSKNAAAANTNLVLYFARPDSAYTAVALDTVSNTTARVANLVNQIVKNQNEYTNIEGNFDTDVVYVAKYPGAIGNSLRVGVCDTATAFSSNISVSNTTVNTFIDFRIGSEVATVKFEGTSNASANTIAALIGIGDQILSGNTTLGFQYLQVKSLTVSSSYVNSSSIGFDGSADVNSNLNFITISNNPYTNGDIVTYANVAGNSAVTGLSSGNYYVVEANATGIKLSSAPYGSAIDITSTAAANGTLIGNTNTLAITFEDPYRLRTNYVSNTINRNWEFFNTVETAPGQSTYVLLNGNTSANDEMHVVVVDDGGEFTGTPGTILEVYKGVSRATDSKNGDGSTNYYKDIINQNSAYIWFANDRSNAPSNTASNLISSNNQAPLNIRLSLGADGSDEANVSLGVLGTAYDMFASAEDVDISLILQGKPVGGTTVVNGTTVQNYQLANYIIDNICEIRKDCVALVSPDKNLVLNAFGSEALNLAAWRGALRSTSYAVMDSGYKYMYDRYNDIYRWIPLNGDIAGLCVRTDQTNDAWWSPAGFNRGQIKNLVKLAYNPRKAERDILYKNGVNPVVTFPGQGTVLFGDKTLQAKPSAFDRINVRRLFIVLEKAISTAAKYSLFEFNDAFTRAQFKNLVVPYLRTVQGRRGITDFLVVCDDTNNTPQIIDTNQFVGDIYIKPARSINFIQLNFVAVGTGVQFSEVVGKF
jgi:hypothetical protein